MARIDTLANFITDIVIAIKSKTGKSELITPANFDTEINSIKAGGSTGKYAPRFIKFTNYSGEDLAYELENIDFSNITTFSSMFDGCKNVKNIDLSNHNIPAVTTVGNAFYNCEKLLELKFGAFDSSKITAMNSTFKNCYLLKRIDLSSWTSTKKITNMDSTFYSCKALEYLDLRTIDFYFVEKYSYMLNYVPTTCEIIVKDSTSKKFFTNKFSTYTNVKTVAELEAEQ